jgi:hypothetical protein
MIVRRAIDAMKTQSLATQTATQPTHGASA